MDDTKTRPVIDLGQSVSVLLRGTLDTVGECVRDGDEGPLDGVVINLIGGRQVVIPIEPEAVVLLAPHLYGDVQITIRVIPEAS